MIQLIGRYWAMGAKEVITNGLINQRINTSNVDHNWLKRGLLTVRLGKDLKNRGD